jgi:hypothetical protein
VKPIVPPDNPKVENSEKVSVQRQGQGSQDIDGPEGGRAQEKFRHNIDEQLQKPGPVKTAFERLCAAGCDAKELRGSLHSLAHYPLKRSRRAYTSNDARKLKAVLTKLDSVAKDLRRLSSELRLRLMRTGLGLDAVKVDSIANSIRERVESSIFKNMSQYTASQRLPFLVRKVKDKTGKPHFAELATLFGAAYQQPDFSEDELKMRFHREMKQRNKLAARWAESSQEKNTDPV